MNHNYSPATVAVRTRYFRTRPTRAPRDPVRNLRRPNRPAKDRSPPGPVPATPAACNDLLHASTTAARTDVVKNGRIFFEANAYTTATRTRVSHTSSARQSRRQRSVGETGHARTTRVRPRVFPPTPQPPEVPSCVRVESNYGETSGTTRTFRGSLRRVRRRIATLFPVGQRVRAPARNCERSAIRADETTRRRAVRAATDLWAANRSRRARTAVMETRRGDVYDWIFPVLH